jgi:hypothetical protein
MALEYSRILVKFQQAICKSAYLNVIDNKKKIHKCVNHSGFALTPY